eukprot:TRINITY_DN2931_c0_g1_i5.p1 TRINITY_DN2931_c0_g1~~TRINITY_DN2931_c0_g1_i5.p1  ORF type:complete len:879 (+),score=179.64 TRINITY_DN2931_c0_g1_i5:37-2673(+)
MADFYFDNLMYGSSIELFILFLIPVISIPLIILMSRLIVIMMLQLGVPRKYLIRPYREKIALYMATSGVGALWLVFQIGISILACFTYVLELYIWEDWPRQPIIIDLMEIGFALFFFLDYIISFYVAKDSLRFFFTFMSFIDLGSILPILEVFFPRSGLHSWLGFFRPLRLLRAYRLLSFSTNSVQRQIFVVVLTGLSLIFCSTCIIQKVETFYANRQLMFHEALYFIVVTFSTVGYEDIITSPQGRLVMLFLIIFAILLIPYQTGRLLSLVSSRRGGVYGGYYKASKGSRHLVIMGEITFTGLVDFFRELYHQEKSNPFRNAQVVILSAKEPSLELKGLLTHPFFEPRVTYLLGTPLAEGDLERVSIQHAHACFVLTDKYCAHSNEADSETALRVLAVNHYSPNLLTCVQLMQRSNMMHIPSSPSSFVLCAEEFSLSLLSRSCLVPGLLTLVTNLVRTYAHQPPEEMSTWFSEYYHGSSHRIYKTFLSVSCDHVPFGELALTIYREFQTILFAVEVEPHKIVLNPGNRYVLRAHQAIFVIAKNQRIVTAINMNKMSAVREEPVLPLTEKAQELKISQNLRGLSNPMRKTKENFQFFDDDDDDEADDVEKLDINESQTDKLPKSEHGPSLEDTIFLGEDSAWRKALVMARPLRALEDCLVDSVEKLKNSSGPLKSHLIVCGVPSASLLTFLVPLRYRLLPALQPIVFLNNQEPPEDFLIIIRSFPDVYYVKGSALHSYDLHRAGVKTAEQVVILSNVSGGKHTKDEFMIDSETIFCLRKLEESHPHLSFTIAELGLFAKTSVKSHRDAPMFTDHQYPNSSRLEHQVRSPVRLRSFSSYGAGAHFSEPVEDDGLPPILSGVLRELSWDQICSEYDICRI